MLLHAWLTEFSRHFSKEGEGDEFFSERELTLMAMLVNRFTVAAFSPGVKIDAECKLKKICVDGKNCDFYFRPFTLPAPEVAKYRQSE